METHLLYQSRSGATALYGQSVARPEGKSLRRGSKTCYLINKPTDFLMQGDETSVVREVAFGDCC